MAKDHNFKAQIEWCSQSLPFRYKTYSRDYVIRISGKPDIQATAAPEFLGNPYRLNPEDMLVASLSACHMLTYLAFAANSKVEVLNYVDDASGKLVQNGKIMQFESVTIKPKITITKNTDLEKAKSLHKKAHEGCFIANSINFKIHIEPEFIQAQDS